MQLSLACYLRGVIINRPNKVVLLVHDKTLDNSNEKIKSGGNICLFTESQTELNCLVETWLKKNSSENTLHPVWPVNDGGCNGEEFSLYFWDEEMTPELDIPACEEGVGTTHGSRLWEKWSQNKHSAASPLALCDAAVNTNQTWATRKQVVLLPATHFNGSMVLQANSSMNSQIIQINLSSSWMETKSLHSGKNQLCLTVFWVSVFFVRSSPTWGSAPSDRELWILLSVRCPFCLTWQKTVWGRWPPCCLCPDQEPPPLRMKGDQSPAWTSWSASGSAAAEGGKSDRMWTYAFSLFVCIRCVSALMNTYNYKF